MIGASFAPWRAAGHGLNPGEALNAVLDLGLNPIRLSASWRAIDAEGFGPLDALLSISQARGASVILTAGLKAQGWPEFHLPPWVDRGTETSIDAAKRVPLRVGSLHMVRAVVQRYHDHPAIIAWQVENEPFNRSGPLDWWIDRGWIRKEIREVRTRDPRPIVVNVFAPFNAAVDANSSRHHGKPRRPWHLPPEREALAVLRGGDILGLDVYRAIGRGTREHSWVERADVQQLSLLSKWRRLAHAQRKQAWITEAQAEPWEPSGGSIAQPQTVGPGDGPRLMRDLQAIGFRTILYWGCEYWLWRAKEGDRRWVDEIRRSGRPPLSPTRVPGLPARAS
jgi:hypothetical protein